MASKKSAAYPHKWPNGEYHSIPWSEAKQNPANQGPAKGLPPGSAPLPPPPPGTYDPAIDYNAQAAQRGYENTFDDSRTAYTQGQEDYGLGLSDLLTGRDRGLADLRTGIDDAHEDYENNTAELGRQFGILGRQQAERAAQQGITSQGLLGKSASVRGENQAREQANLDRVERRNQDAYNTNFGRINEDYARGKQGLDLGNARNFGGAFGNTILNPLTSQPQVGSLLTSLTRAGTENNAFQTFSGGQRASQAAQNGYVAPGLIPPAPGSRTAAANDFIKRLRGRVT